MASERNLSLICRLDVDAAACLSLDRKQLLLPPATHGVGVTAASDDAPEQSLNPQAAMRIQDLCSDERPPSPTPERRLSVSTPPMGSSLAVLVRIPALGARPVAVRATEVKPCERVLHAPEMCPHKKKKRKRTEDVRKKECAQLHDELEELEARLNALKKQARADKETVAATPFSKLEEANQEMFLHVAGIRCLLSQPLLQDIEAPVHTYVHLGRTMEDRRRVILDLKPKQLRIGREIIEQRTGYLDLAKNHISNEWFTTRAGDACGLHLHIDILRDRHCVERVYNTAVAYTSTYEVSVKKSVSVMTYHDAETNVQHNSNSQFKLVITTADGPVIEANTILFCHYDPVEDTGIIVGNYVDQDDLRPYYPDKRIRQEVTAVLMLSPSPQGVIVRHWVHTRTRYAEHLVGSVDFSSFARENEGHKGEDLLGYIRSQLYK